MEGNESRMDRQIPVPSHFAMIIPVFLCYLHSWNMIWCVRQGGVQLGQTAAFTVIGSAMVGSVREDFL